MKEIRRLLAKGAYKKVVRLSEEINWEKERNLRLLPEIARAYEQLERFVDAENVLLFAYERGQTGKGNVYRIIELCAKTGDVTNAEYFYKEFIDRWCNSSEMQVVEYYMSKLHKAPIKEQIMRLEKCCHGNPREDWLYELTVLYDLAGNSEECIFACHKLILYFGAGNYTKKAIEIRRKYSELTQEEKNQLLQSENKRNNDTQFNPQIDISLLNQTLLHPENTDTEEIKEQEVAEQEISEGKADEIQERVINQIVDLKNTVEEIYEEEIEQREEQVEEIVEAEPVEEATEKETMVEILSDKFDKKTEKASVFCSWIRDYARDNAAEIDEEVYLQIALFAEKKNSSREELNQKLAFDMVQSAIAKAREKKLFDFWVTKYNQEGRLILQVKHFAL
jgi:hypothetical protein